MKRVWMRILLMAIVAPALLLAACAPAEPTAEPTAEPVEQPAEPMPTEVPPTEAPMDDVGVELPPVDPLEVEGDIVTAGSSTVFPLSEAVADMFVSDGYAGQITIDSIGSGAGFERFCSAGETDISNASRAINAEEVENCQAIGREPIEFRMATDALAVVVSSENEFVDELTMEELAIVFSTAETWADVRADWPAEPIQRFTPGTDSGTFDYFIEEVFEEDPEPALNASNLQLSEDDNVLVQGVEGSPYAIGYFGFAYFAENEGRLKAVAVDGVAPTAEAVDAGTYPLARPLFVYSTAEIMNEKPQVAAFLNYYLSNVDDAVEQVGYFPASPDALDAAKTKWLEAMGMAAGAAAADDAGVCDLVELAAVDPLEVEGDIVTAGSSTVFPLSEAVADMFVSDGYAGQITIDSIGSGAGFERFCSAGETDISNASRAIKPEEVENCRAIGREPIEFRMATDALAVVVSSENEFVDELTMEELAIVFSTAETWADVRADWPAEPIQRFTPGTDSGTFDYFIEAVFEEDPEPALNAANLQLSEDDNVLVQGVEGSPYAIGYFGFAYFAENEGRLKAVAVDGVAPTAEAVDAGTYPLARPLFVYSTAEIMNEKPQVAAFLNYYLSNVNDAVEQVGYFPAGCEVLNAAREAWLAAVAP